MDSKTTLNEVIADGGHTTWHMGIVRELRERAGLPSDINLHKVNLVVDDFNGDFDLALSALTMIPRPAWVNEKLGLHPERTS